MSQRRHMIGPTLAAVAGRGLAVLFFVLGKVRRGRGKALHTRGELVRAQLRRRGARHIRTRVDWLDAPGVDDVLVRLSRSIGLPSPLPDVLGLAMRIAVGPDRHGDVLLATTGTGVAGRFLLRPARDMRKTAYSSLFPYRTVTGPLLLAAFPSSARFGQFDLAWARPTGSWVVFGTLELLDAPGGASDAAVSFDPVLNVIPGLEPYDWSLQLREFSYAAARRSRAL